MKSIVSMVKKEKEMFMLGFLMLLRIVAVVIVIALQ